MFSWQKRHGCPGTILPCDWSKLAAWWLAVVGLTLVTSHFEFIMSHSDGQNGAILIIAFWPEERAAPRLCLVHVAGAFDDSL
jgi:hypothetical protein